MPEALGADVWIAVPGRQRGGCQRQGLACFHSRSFAGTCGQVARCTAHFHTALFLRSCSPATYKACCCSHSSRCSSCSTRAVPALRLSGLPKLHTQAEDTYKASGACMLIWKWLGPE